jgi:hypothetical protein
MTDAVVILTTVANPIEGEMLIKGVLHRRLIDCQTRVQQ